MSESQVHLPKIWDQTNGLGSDFRVKAVSDGTLVAIFSLNEKSKFCGLAQLQDVTGKRANVPGMGM